MMPEKDEIRNLVRDVVRQVLSESMAGPPQSPPAYYAPWTGVEYDAHPSRQQFNINEAAFGKGDGIEFAQSQQCSIEKDKPCDHCGMCRSLGF
jgi:hypothetical protein